MLEVLEYASGSFRFVKPKYSEAQGQAVNGCGFGTDALCQLGAPLGGTGLGIHIFARSQCRRDPDETPPCGLAVDYRYRIALVDGGDLVGEVYCPTIGDLVQLLALLAPFSRVYSRDSSWARSLPGIPESESDEPDIEDAFECS